MVLTLVPAACALSWPLLGSQPLLHAAPPHLQGITREQDKNRGFHLPASQQAVNLIKIMLSLTVTHRGSTCPSWRT